MKSIILVVLSFLLLSKPTLADPKTQMIMNELLENYMALLNYTHGHKEVSHKVISKHLKGIKKAFKSSRHSKMLKAPNFSPIAHAMRESIDEIDQHYHSTLDDYARYRLKRLTSLCISCHSQLPKERYPKVYNKYKKTINQYVWNRQDKARLAFLFRDYNQALGIRKALFEKTPSKNFLGQVMKIYLVNLNDKEAARGYLDVIKDSPNYSKRIKMIAKQWSSEIKNTDLMRKVTMNKQQWIKMLISKYLVPKRQVFQDRISTDSVMIAYQMQRILYNYLVFHPDSILSAELLYWLGVLENKERNIDLYTLGEMYFEQCIIRHPKSLIAQRCYDAYYSAIHEGFTGSSGTNIPREFKVKLDKYKKMVLPAK